jgi:hypothetical protein
MVRLNVEFFGIEALEFFLKSEKDLADVFVIVSML